MIALLLASWLCGQAWSWDTVQGAAGYRVYWANDPAGPWCVENVEDVPATACDTTVCEWNPPMPHADFYWVAVAFNGAGESAWPVSVPRATCDVE